MVARCDLMTQIEQARVRHQLDPDSRQHNLGFTYQDLRVTIRNSRLTCGSELCVQPFRLDSLEAKTGTHESKSNKGQGVRPCRISSVIPNTRLAALP